MLYHILLIQGLHHKNEYAMSKYKNIKWTRVRELHECNDLTPFDAVFFPGKMTDVSKYPHVKFIFGPHLAVFPNDSMSCLLGNNSIYIQPSQWVVDYWKLYPVCSNLTMKALPFGVDTDKFFPNPIYTDRSNIFVYLKRRQPAELQMILEYLDSMCIAYKLFDYKDGDGYDEQEYIQYLQTCKYGIWLGAHESQGFALEEALSCNVPLLVWSVSSLNQEYGYNYPDFPATTVPYWDACCGELFYNHSDFASSFSLFLSKLDSYTPREYIVDHLSIPICEQKFIDVITSFT
jgi:glycosyltransferase involved in cell wall biosynthesis